MAAMKDVRPKPRLKNLDALFQLNDGKNPLEQAVTSSEVASPMKRTVIVVSVDRLSPFPGHPFHLYEGERLDDMVESIRANGVLIPIIARNTGAGFEVLSGHNRVNAAKQAGLVTVPVIMLEGVSDDEAWMYVVETNLMQRSFSDMCHSEKAAVIATQHSKLFSQGKRNDILRELQTLENPDGYRADGTSVQVEHKLKSREVVAKEYGLSKDTVARYLRIHHLIAALKDRLDNGEFAFIPAVTLSFLQEAEQSLVDDCIAQNGLVVDMKKAAALRHYSEKGTLNRDSVYLILSGKTGQKPPPNRNPTVKVSKSVYARYFRPGQSVKEVQGIVEKALEMYFGLT